MTRRLAILAHFDARGRVAPHVERHLDELSEAFSDVLVVTTSALDAPGRRAILRRARLIERPNVGQDFTSWFIGLERCQWARRYDEVLLTNDSYVSVIGDHRALIAHMVQQDADVWGMTKTRRIAEHIQSYFLFFSSSALHSAAFHGFWRDFTSAPDRATTIARHEVGLSQAFVNAGFSLGAYLVPTRAERLLANRRAVHWLHTRRRVFPHRFQGLEDYFDIAKAHDPAQSEYLNGAVDFADLVLERRRLPIVKFDTLRYDPHWLGSEALLRGCERLYAREFTGVRQYLASTASSYPPRTDENSGPAELTSQERRAIGYRSRPARRLAR